MRAYHRLTESERNQVYALKKAGLTVRSHIKWASERFKLWRL